MTHQFNPTILREYDIRGIVGDTLTEDDAYALGRTFSAMARDVGATRIAVGRDGRTHSGMLEAALVRGLAEGGIEAVLTGMGPSPMLYFATHYLDVDGGIQVTGSHNPADYNGFKLLLKGRSVFGQEIQAIGKRAASGHWSEGNGPTEEVDIREAYVDRLLEGFSGKAYRVGWDAGNGAAGPILDMLVERLPGQHHVIFSRVDGTFPNHHPDPTVPENLEDLIAAVEKDGAEIGIAFDGDADRIGVVDDKGEIVWGDRILILYARDVLARTGAGQPIIFDVKCSQALPDAIQRAGGKPIMWKTGHSLIKDKMKETHAPLAGEMSGHMFFSEGFYGHDDALYGAARLLRILADSGKTVRQLLADVPNFVSTPEIRVEVPEEKKFGLVDRAVEHFRGTHDVIDVDGARVLFGDGWGLIRASNTQPVLVARYEASSPQRLAAIQGEMEGWLRSQGVSV